MCHEILWEQVLISSWGLVWGLLSTLVIILWLARGAIGSLHLPKAGFVGGMTHSLPPQYILSRPSNEKFCNKFKVLIWSIPCSGGHATNNCAFAKAFWNNLTHHTSDNWKIMPWTHVHMDRGQFSASESQLILESQNIARIFRSQWLSWLSWIQVLNCLKLTIRHRCTIHMHYHVLFMSLSWFQRSLIFKIALSQFSQNELFEPSQQRVNIIQ